MNKQCFRVIFNKTLQCFVVVSELAKVEGKSAEGKEKFTLSRYPYFVALRPLTFSLFCALGLVSLPTLAQAETLIIRADESAPKNQQPIILQTANGIPQVNIQTPNDKGLSHNKYSKFDVDTKGAILNNSRKNTSTQQAGWVQGNPYLAKGEAKVILNEVNSNDPSLLKGYVEVAGQKADVIIANPSGIHCSGCGIINSDRATFSTGKPQIQNGNLEGFVVEKGKVQVDGKGLDNSRVDYTEILSREVKANAGIWSKKEVDVVTGKNKVKRLTPESSNGNGASTQAGALQIIHTEQTDSNETAPQFAVDVGELGGMYAGKIHLIGTEKGLGVRNAGHIGASSDSLQIDSQGRIINTGTLNAAQALSLTSTQDIENQNTGKIENHQGDIRLNSKSTIQQQGSVVARQGDVHKQAEKGITQQGETLAQGNIHYSAPTIEATRLSLIAAGVNVQDSVQGEVRRLEERTAQGKMIQIVARDQVMLHGKNLASGGLSVHTENLNLNHSQNYAYNINVEARTGDINVDFARLEAKEKLIFKTPKRLSTESSYLSAMHIETNQQTLYAKDAVWKQTGTADLRLNAENISTLGAVFTTQGHFFIEGKSLENAQGTLHSAKSLRLTLQDDIISTKGQLFANEHIAIQANNLSNDDGIIYANQNISVVNKGVLNNRKGILVSKAGNLAINTHGNHIQNSMGKIVAAQKLNVQSETLDNREGVISAGHNIIHAKHIDNRAISDKGSVISGETLILNVTQLDNQQTKAKGALPQRGIQGVNLNINTATLNNQQGGVYAQKLADIRSDFRFNNQQGELLSADAMVISHQNNLMINNQEGMIQGKNRIALEAKGIESEGSIQTAGDLMISIKESFSLNKAFEVGNNLIFKTAGNFENNVIQRVGNKAILSAHEIINHKDAEVSANETQFTSQILTNRGLIDGYKTDINSANLRNIGTGKIYGNYLTIQSAHLQNLAESVNGQSHSATIAAREKLQLAVGTLTNRNHALILSLGDLVIGGQVNDQGNVIGNATLVDNGSATIEALGKGDINTSALINQNLNFSTKQVELPTTYHKEYATSQSGERLSGGRYDRRSSAKNQSYASYYTKEGKRIDSRDWFIWDYRIESNKSEIDQTDPAKILIGGDATFIGSLENDKSQIIIGGRLSAESSEIHNKDAEGVISSIHLGRFTHSYVKRKFYKRKRRPRRFESSRDYKAPQPDQIFQLGAFTLLENANVADYASGLKIGSQETASNIKVEPVEINPQALNSTHLSSTNKDKNVSINSAVINGGISGIKTHPVDAKLPQASLYRINPDNPQGYLIETDPKFTQRKQWLSSDYMFEQLRYDHNRTHKRLGDGFYEQRLVNEQINQLTGRRFIEGYNSDFEQYKFLMNNGVKYAKQFNLTLGVGLTAEQMSELTSDMVWLVNKEVILSNGQKLNVLTPQVYLVARNTDIRTSGALISANEIIANVGDLTNSGIIAGRDLNHIHTKQLENLGIVLGKTVDLSAKQNLINLGGRIEAVDSLLLDAGKKLEIASRQSYAKSAEGNFERQIVDRVGTVKVTSDRGILQLQSREDLTLKGALIDSQGVLKAGAKTVSITTLKNQNKEHYSINRDNYYHLEQKNEVGSQLKGKADVVIVGEDNVNIRQGQILSEAGALKIAALKGNVKIETGRAEEHFASSVKTTSKGLLSKSTNISQHKHEINSAVESSLQGDSVMLYAGDTLTDEGSTIKAKQNIHLEGQERVYLNAAQSKRREHHYVASKKSGFSASFSQGSARIGIGRSEQQERDTEYQIEHQGSQLSTQYGNIAVLSNLGNVTANATKFESGKDILVEGKQIHFNAKIDQTDNVYSYSSNSKGFGIGLVYNPAAVFKSRYGEQSSQGSAGSLVGKSVTAGETFDKTFQQVLNGASPYLTANKKQREGFAHTEKANVVETNAGGNLFVRATEGDITSQGSHLTAQGDGTLQAKGNVDLGVASTEQIQTNRHKQKGIDIDLSRRFTEVVGAYHSKEKGDGSLTKEQASVLSFGGKGLIAAEKGNVTLAGTQAVSHNDMIIWAGKDVRITTANTLRAQNESSTGHGIGEAVVSETERFSGYNRKLSNQDGKSVRHQGSMVASLNGGIDIYSSKDIHQTSGQVLAKDKIKVSAESVTIDSAHNTQHHRSHASDLKVGQFTRVISPIIDLINATENAVKNKEASDRVKAAQLMGLAAQGYTLKNTAESVLNNDDKAVLFRVESGVGLSHSRQNQTGESRESVGNLLNAKQLEIEARSGKLSATHTDFTSRDENGKRLAGSSISLKAKEGLVLQAGESHSKQVGKNQSYGTEVGTAFSVGAKTGWSFYAKEGFSKGKQTSEGKTYHNSHLDTETLHLESGGDTTLTGTTAKANTINADIKGNLTIESLQDKHNQNSKQIGLGTKVEFGFGSAWEFSGNANASGGKAAGKQVNEQSGLFAEEGGYHIHANNVHLEGGVIASTNPNNSKLTTNKLTFKDLQNSSHYSATSGAISGGYKTEGGDGNTNVSPSLPMHQQGKDSATTKATLTEGKITLDKDSNPTVTTAEALGINTNLTEANKPITQYDLAEQEKKKAAVASIVKAGANFVGTISQEMKWEDGSPQKMALHGLVGFIAGKEGGGDLLAGAASTVGSELLNTYVAEYLGKHTNLSQEQRNAIQSLTATGLGMAIGNAIGGDSQTTTIGMNIARLTEENNRQLHPSEIELIRANAEKYAALQGISKEKAIEQLTEEGLRGVSDDAAHLVENKQARAYLNELQAKAKNKALFAILDRGTDEYKNSLLNSQYIASNKDLYNRVKLTDTALSSSEWLLSKGIQENRNYHKQAGKETVLSVYESALEAMNKRRISASGLKQYTENDQAQSNASRDEKAANQLNNILTTNYPNARGLFTLGEFLSTDNAYGKAAMGAIAESGWAIGVGKTVQVHSGGKAKPTNESGKITDSITTAEVKSDVANLGKNNPKFNAELNNKISSWIEINIYNTNAVNKLSQGVLPGYALDNKTKLPVEGKNGVPRNMPPSSNPDRMALDFAEKFLGRKITSAEWEAGRDLFKKNGIGKDCINCFKVDLGNRQSIVYRSGANDNSSYKTLSGTATLEIKTNEILDLNSEQPLKLKFPKSLGGK